VIGRPLRPLGPRGANVGVVAISLDDIHNGADDNASGTANVIELARRLARARAPTSRRVVFIVGGFPGEERGLLGVGHYYSNTLYPLSRIP